MKYRTRNGVVLTEVCDQFLLVSAEKNWDFCPYVIQINETSAFLWRKLELGADLETLVLAVAEEYKVEDFNAAREAIESFIRQMSEMNYLLSEETEG